MGLIAFLLYVFIAFALVTGFLTGYTRQIADRALTDRSRAAEATADGRIPPEWVTQINRRRRAMRPFQGDVSGTELALEKIGCRRWCIMDAFVLFHAWAWL